MMADDTKQTEVLFDKSFQTAIAPPNPDEVDDDDEEDDGTDTAGATATSVEVTDPYSMCVVDDIMDHELGITSPIINPLSS